MDDSFYKSSKLFLKLFLEKYIINSIFLWYFHDYESKIHFYEVNMGPQQGTFWFLFSFFLLVEIDHVKLKYIL